VSRAGKATFAYAVKTLFDIGCRVGQLVDEDEFIEIYCNTNLEIYEQRDKKACMPKQGVVRLSIRRYFITIRAVD